MADEIPEIKPVVSQPPPPEPTPVRHISESYQDDLSQAMNATDASVVQALLQDAKDRETYATTEARRKRERKWYAATSLVLLIISLAAIGYGFYRYTHFTVPVQQTISVGAFPTTDPIVASTTTISGVLKTLAAETDLKQDQPYLVPLVTDAQTQTLLSNNDFFSFLQANADDPFVTIFDSARLGVVETATGITPFIICSVPDPVAATREFLIEEPNLLQMFSQALNIDLTKLPPQIGTTYLQEYRYNLPVRSLSYIDTNGTTQDVLLYGFASNNIIVITTDPTVLKEISDGIAAEH